MTINKKSILFLILLASTLQFGCLPEEILGGGQSFTAKINGEDFKADRRFSSATIIQGADGDYQVNIAGLNVISLVTLRGQYVAMSFSENNFSNLSAGQSFQGYDPNTEKGVLCYYFDTTDMEDPILFGSFFSSLGEFGVYENVSSSLRITSINRNEETISGEFSFEVYYPDEDVTYTITDGKFRNLPYSVEEEEVEI